jgi:signal transduction histidine kinase
VLRLAVKPLTIRSYLIAFLIISVLPVLVFSGVMTTLFWRQQRAAFERQFLDRVRAMSIALDSELQGYTSALRVLTHSAHLGSGDLARFYEQAQRVRAEQPTWGTIVLADAEGRQLINLRMPFGAPLPHVAPEPAVFAAVIKARQPVVSGLFENPVNGGYSTAVAVPVMRDGAVTHVLVAVIDQGSWVRFLSRYPVAPDATMTLLDQDGIVIARTLNNDRWAGKRPAPDLYEALRISSEAAYRSTGLEGQRFYSAHHRSSRSGWTAATGVPVEGVEAALRGSTFATAAGAGAMLVVAIGVALLLGRRIAGPAMALARTANTLASGGRASPGPAAPVVEFATAAAALHHAAAEIDAREAALRQRTTEAETARDELAHQVAALTLLADLSTRLVPKGELRDPLLEILDAGMQITEADMGNIQLRDVRTGRLETAVHRGFGSEFPEFFGSIQDHAAAWGTAMATGQRLIVDDVTDDPIFAGSEARAVLLRAGVRATQSTPLRSHSGELIGMLSTHYRLPRHPEARDLRLLDVLARLAADYIERARAERATDEAHARLQAADRAKDEFLAMLGHELRNPLGAVAGAVHVLTVAENSPEAMARARAIIDRQVQHLSRLVDDLLDVSRVTTGKVLLTREPLDLAGLVAGAMSTWRAARRFDRHDVSSELCPVWVDGDATRLEQILDNLVGNALKYTPAGGRITVRVGPDGQDAVLEVADTGTGIAPEVIEKVFDLFVQGDGGLDRVQGGLGIGLTLVKALTALHGGAVDVESDGPGKGSVFTVHRGSRPACPASRGSRHETTRPPAPDPRHRGQRRRA